MSESPQVPAGWYGDPHDATMLRYWDGAAWTEHTAPAVRQPSPTTVATAPARKRLSTGAIIGIVVGAVVLVLVVVGVLVATAVPVFNQQQDKAYDAAAKADLVSLRLVIAYAWVDDPVNGPDGVHEESGAWVVDGGSVANDTVWPTPGTELGGYEERGSDGFCAWVRSATGAAFSIDQNGTIVEGSCS